MVALTRLEDVGRTFVAPKPLSRSRPRDVRLTAAGRALMTVALLLFAGAAGAGIAMYGEAHSQAENRRALVEDGVMTTGEVIRLWQSGDNRRRVVYRFVAAGRPLEGQARVSTERRRALLMGSPLPVRYLPSNPRVNDLGGTPREGMPMVLPFVVAIGIAAGGVLFLLVLNRQRRLLAEGRAAPAVVMTHTKHHSSHGGTHRAMTYQFPLLSGAVAVGKSSTSSKPPAIGSVICVVYDPDRPSRNMVYPLSLVTPAPR